MIRRKASDAIITTTDQPKGFDDFELRLGDIMRGERATMGKSLLDVQRELRIKAAYISAIENSDPGAFDTPGFIAGYVRSYARYLGMDPDQAFATFCSESGFEVAHGMSAQASVLRPSGADTGLTDRAAGGDIFARGGTPFAVEGESFFSGIELRAVGSVAVLATLICAIGYGGWSVLQEVQRVQVAPVDQTPVVLSDIDPLRGAGVAPTGSDLSGADTVPSIEDLTRGDALDRLYRPQALDVPVLDPRDAAIATLDPRETGNFADPQRTDTTRLSVIEREMTPPLPSVPQVVEAASPELQIVAVRPAWVRVRAADGTTLFEGVLESGATWTVPAMETAPDLRVGASGAIYFAMDGQHYGPAGPRGTVTSNIALDRVALAQAYAPADPAADEGLERFIAALQPSE